MAYFLGQRLSQTRLSFRTWETRIMAATPHRLHPLHVHNLNQLILLRAAIQQDPVLACYEHGIDKKSAESYRSATDEQLLHFAYSVDMSLFVPRFLGEELCKILTAPDEIRGIVVATNLQNSRQVNAAKEQVRGNGGYSRPIRVSGRSS